VEVVNWPGLLLVLAALAVTGVGGLIPLAYGPWNCRFCGAPFGSEAEGAAHSRAVHGQQ
jgi:hypothetical protein